MGITLDELKGFSPTFKGSVFAFSYEVGVYLSQLASFLHRLGKHVELQLEAPDIRDLRVSHNDFIGANVYRLALDNFRPKEGALSEQSSWLWLISVPLFTYYRDSSE